MTIVLKNPFRLGQLHQKRKSSILGLSLLFRFLVKLFKLKVPSSMVPIFITNFGLSALDDQFQLVFGLGVMVSSRL
jgi:hypothetical protein